MLSIARLLSPFGKVPILAGVTGVLVGLVGVAFYAVTLIGYNFFFGYLGNFAHPETGSNEYLMHSTLWLGKVLSLIPAADDTGPNLWIVALVPALGGLLMAVWATYTKDSGGYGTDRAIRAYHGERGKLPRGTLRKKFVACCLSIGTGAPGGREGPIALMGASIGANVAERFRLTVRERRILLAAGIAAGVGGMFRAPLAGGLLAAEVLYHDSEFEPEVLIPSMLASVMSYCVFCLNFGWGSILSGVAADYTFHNPLELIPFAALAVVLVVVGLLFVKLSSLITYVMKPIPENVRPAIGAGVGGLIALALILYTGSAHTMLFSVVGDGYPGLQEILNGEGVWNIVLLLAAGKMLASAFAVNSGGAVGIFAPSMVVGGAVGGAVGMLFSGILPTGWNVTTSVGAFALVGMAGYYAAVAKTPVSTVIIVSELTGSYHLLLPSIWVCSITFMLARRFRAYPSQVSTRKESAAHRGDFATNVLEDIRVRDILKELVDVETVQENTLLREIIAMKTSRQAYYPVLDKEGKFAGIFSLNDLRSVLDEQEVWELLVAADIEYTDVVTVHPNDTLALVAEKFADTQFEELPVVDDDDERKLLGMISRRQLNSAYIRRMIDYDRAKLEEGTSVDQIGSGRLPAIDGS